MCQIVSNPTPELASAILGQTELVPLCCLLPITFFQRKQGDVQRKCKVHDCRSCKQRNRISWYVITHLSFKMLELKTVLLCSVFWAGTAEGAHRGNKILCEVACCVDVGRNMILQFPLLFSCELLSNTQH